MYDESGSTARSGHSDVLVVGGGFSGVATLHALRRRGLDARLLEAGSDVGGVWFWNTYPGARCDAEVFDYSFAFPELEQEWDWSHRFAFGDELQGHIAYAVDRLDLRQHVVLGARVASAVFDEDAHRWTLTTDDDREFVAPHVVWATGALSASQLPAIPGVETFEGVAVHTGQWPEGGVDVAGRRVGVVGTGSSGVQIIPPMAEEAGELVVFQRTANHVVQAQNRPMDEAWRAELRATAAERRHLQRTTTAGLSIEISTQSALEVSDEERLAEYERRWELGGFNMLVAFNDLDTDERAAATADAFVRDKIRQAVEDPAVAEKLMPGDHPFGTKRVGVGHDYYETFNRENVRLCDARTEAIARVTPRGILLSTGEEVELDVLIFATGFDSFTGAMTRVDIRGRGGRSLADKWADGASTYLGLGVAGFPNLFMVNGPGSPSVFGNAPVTGEDIGGWIADLLMDAAAQGIVEVEAEQEPEDAWTEHLIEVADRRLLRKLTNTWYHGGNTPGKRPRFMAYSGGGNAYQQRLVEARDKGYQGFRLVRAGDAATGAAAPTGGGTAGGGAADASGAATSEGGPTGAADRGVRPGHVVGGIVLVASIEATLPLYRDVLGLDVEGPGPIDPALVGALALPDVEGRQVVLRADGFPAGTLTLLEVPGLPADPRGRVDATESGRTTPVFSSPALNRMADGLAALGVPRIADPVPSTSEWGVSQEFISYDADGSAVCLLEMKPLPGRPVHLDLSAPWEHDRTDQVSPVVRMSLMTDDLDGAIAFYRDALGMAFIEQREFSGDVATTLGLPPCRIRMAYLGAEGSAWEPGLCALGLTEISDPPPPSAPVPSTAGVHVGQVATVIAVDDPGQALCVAHEHGARIIDDGAAFFAPGGHLVVLVPAR